MWSLQLDFLTKCLLMVLMAVIILYWIKSRKRLAMIARLPGPTPLPIIGSYLELVKHNYDVLSALTDLAKRYDGFYRAWVFHIPLVVITAPEHLKTFYTSSALHDRSDQYDVVSDIFGEVLLVAGGSNWRKLRKMFVTNFSHTPSGILRNNFTGQSKKLLDAFRAKANGPMFPCYQILISASANAIFLNALGEEIPEGDMESFLQAEDSVLRIAYSRIYTILLHYGFTLNFMPQGRELSKGASFIDSLVKKIVDKKRTQLAVMKEKKENVPNIYIYNLLENHSHESSDMLIGDVKNLLITGLDTIAGTMSYVLTVLGIFPEIQEKVYQEDQEVQMRLAGRELEVEDLQQYVYLEQVIKETLRVLPIGPTIARKLGEDTYFGKHLVPKGVDVVTIPSFTYQNPSLFPDPHKFDPDRWLPQNMDHLPPFAFNPFSAGPRICPGMRYAYMAMKIFLPSVVREFQITSNYANLDEVMNNKTIEITMKDKDGHLITLESRTAP